MFVAGIDAHATYSVIAIVSNTGQLVAGPIRIKNTQEDRLDDLLERYQPLEVVVETSPAWPWLFDRLEGKGIRFVLAHAKRLRVIAESNYKSDDIDAELLARMRLAGLIPEVHPKCIEQREQAVLLRNRARLVRERTRMVNRIHAQIHNVGLHLERGRLLTQDGRQWICDVAWPLLGEERRLFIDMQWELIDQIVPMIKTLDRRVEHMGREIPARGPTRDRSRHRSLPGSAHRHRGAAHQTISHTGAPRELRRSRSTLLTVRAPAHPPRIDPGRGQPLAEGHLRPGRREPCYSRARQLAIAVVRTDQAAARLAGRSGRYRSPPRSCRTRNAPYG